MPSLTSSITGIRRRCNCNAISFQHAKLIFVVCTNCSPYIQINPSWLISPAALIALCFRSAHLVGTHKIASSLRRHSCIKNDVYTATNRIKFNPLRFSGVLCFSIWKYACRIDYIGTLRFHPIVLIFCTPTISSSLSSVLSQSAIFPPNLQVFAFGNSDERVSQRFDFYRMLQNVQMHSKIHAASSLMLMSSYGFGCFILTKE